MRRFLQRRHNQVLRVLIAFGRMFVVARSAHLVGQAASGRTALPNRWNGGGTAHNEKEIGREVN
jgi:hypothetical protein